MRLVIGLLAALLVSTVAEATVRVNAKITINSSTQTVTCTDARAITRNPPSGGLPTGQFSFTCNTNGIHYVCEPAEPINYSVPTLTIDVATGTNSLACTNGSATGIIVDATIGGSGVFCPAASAITYSPSNNQFSWSCGGLVSMCFPTQATVYDLAARRITVVCGLADPTGTGTATPSTVGRGATTLLKVTAVGGTNPASTNLGVHADLTGIGGSNNQTFFDDGTNGDVTAGDHVFSFLATVGNAATNGAKSLPVTITDGQARSGTTSIAVTVLAPTDPTGSGQATPSSIAPTGSSLLTVSTTPGANPVSSGITVAADLTSIGGLAAQSLYDDGTHGDATAGDGVFSFLVTTQFAVTPGAKSLPVTIADAEGRSNGTTIALTVLTPTNPDGFAVFVPDNVNGSGSTLLTVWTTPGTLPVSSGLTVTANLIGLGGSSTATLNDTGSNGDVTAGDGIYSIDQTLSSVVPGTYLVPVFVTDAQGRSSPMRFATLTVTGAGGLGATGIATPDKVNPGGITLLTVTVTPATSPASTGLIVLVDRTTVGGSANEQMYDDGSHGDVTAGDGVFSLNSPVLPTIAVGPKRLPVTVFDAQARSTSTGIVLEVRGDPIFSDNFDQ